MWTPTALKSEVRDLDGELWRVVEAQHLSSTDRLTDTHKDQELLEGLLETSKPPYPESAVDLHYLLKTPFRYGAPYPYGSRFRRAHSSDGVFYGSEKLATALAETAFYRLLFLSLSDTDKPITPAHPVNHTAFSVRYRANQALDLTVLPLSQDHGQWTDPVSYHATQRLAESAREVGVDAIRYQSIRDPEARANIALLTPDVFTSSPGHFQTWASSIKPGEVHCWRTSGDEHYVFPRSRFERDGKIMAPA